MLCAILTIAGRNTKKEELSENGWMAEARGEAAFLIALALLISTTFITALSQPISGISTTVNEGLSLTVYEDGVVMVEERISPDLRQGDVVIHLLAKEVEKVLAVGDNGEIIGYEQNGSQLTLRGELPRWITIRYETSSLTSKNGSLWTLEVSLPREAVILLPSRAVIISLSNIPEMIMKEGDYLKLVLQPGVWRIDYVLLPTTRGSAQRENTIDPLLILGLLGYPLLALSATLYVRNRRRPPLPSDEERILELVRKRGRISEAEIRSLTHLPKTTVWRVVRRLERRGLVRVTRIDGRNEVEAI